MLKKKEEDILSDLLRLGASIMAFIGIGMLLLSLWGVDVPIGLACAMGSTGAILVMWINAFSPAQNNGQNNPNNANDTNNTNNTNNTEG